MEIKIERAADVQDDGEDHRLDTTTGGKVARIVDSILAAADASGILEDLCVT